MAWLRSGGDAPPAGWYVLYRYKAGGHWPPLQCAAAAIPFPFSLFPFPWSKPDPHQSSSRVRLRVNRGGTAVSVTLMASLVRRVTVSPSSAVNTAWAV